MRFLLTTDIEGVTGVTTYPQAETSQFGRDMLMNDLLAVIRGIRNTGEHEIVVYDMHTDGRNVQLEKLDRNVQVVCGKPVTPEKYKGLGGNFDGLFMIGLHAMARTPGALLAHSYQLSYDSIHINGELVGEIGVETMLAGEQGFPLVFVSGDDMGCEEARRLVPGVVTATVKKSLGENQALCPTPCATAALLEQMAEKAVENIGVPQAKYVSEDIELRIVFSEGRHLDAIQKLHPELMTGRNVVQMRGKGLLKTWSAYLEIEREMVNYGA